MDGNIIKFALQGVNLLDVIDGFEERESAMTLMHNLTEYSIEEVEIQGKMLSYRAYEHIPYVAKPVAPEFQQLSIYVPECYYQGEEINGYSLHTTPIFMPNTVGGYMPGPVDAPNVNDKGEPNTIAKALAHGYVVVSAGARGRGMKDSDGKNIGVAPAGICDLKAAVRFLRHHAKDLPGDMEKIITNGTSAGGAMSALQGTTGNHPDYEAYLEKMGACKERDDVFASSCYCPITNLDNADMAYEWEFYGLHDYHNYHDPNGDGVMSEAQIKLSQELKNIFPAYVNSLHLKDENGNELTLDEDGNGTFKEYVLRTVQASVPDGEEGFANFAELVKYRTRLKAAPAFDSVSATSWENELFGTEEILGRHFSKFAYEHSIVNGDLAEKEQIKMMNPMYYVEDTKADKAKHFRIRHGSVDRDTSLAISNLFAVKLQNVGIDVSLEHPWGIPHAGDYDLDELFAWIDEICSVR